MGENQNPYSRPSTEEQELWWKEGTKGENFRRLYDARIAKREAWNNRNGITTTYKSEESNLPELVVTAPKETEKQKQNRELQKQQKIKEDYINLGTTIAGFTPVLGDVLDAVDVYNEFKQGNYGWGLAGVAAFGLPFIPFRQIKNFGKKTYKWFNAPQRSRELAQRIAGHHSNSSNIARNITNKKHKEFIPVVEEKKQEIAESLRKEMLDDVKYEAAHYHRTPDGEYNLTGQQLMDLRNSQQHPNYIQFAKDNNLDPEDINTAVQFYNQQGTVTRGVFVPDSKRKKYNNDGDPYGSFTLEDPEPDYSLINPDELAIPWLTKANMSLTGGDRLGVGSGLYTSNSFDMSDRYSRQGGNLAKNDELGTSYKAIMQDNRPSLTEEDINQGIEHILNKSESFGLPLQVKQMLGHDIKYKDKILFIEDTFRSNPRYKERAYFGDPQEEVTTIKQIISSNKPEDIVDQHGRWGYKINSRNEDSQLFYPTIINESYISRLMDRLNDFTQKNPEFATEYLKQFKSVSENNTARFTKAMQINRKLMDRQIMGENIAKGIGVAAGIGLTGYGMYKGVNYLQDQFNDKNK